MVDRSKRQVSRIKAKREAKEYIEQLQNSREETASSFSKNVQDHCEKALEYIVDTLENDKVPHEVRSKNARWVCECSGIAPKRDGKGDQQQPLFIAILQKLEQEKLSGKGSGLLGLSSTKESPSQAEEAELVGASANA
jgi:hypothetical protein